MKCRDEEHWMRILLSGWMQRLWTLEEAVLGRDRLRFQFLEGVISLPSIDSQFSHIFGIYSPGLPSLSQNIGTVATDSFPHISKFQLPEASITKPLVKPFELFEGTGPLYHLSGVQLRRTTKEEDQYLCSASLIGLDIRPIAQFNSVLDRARAFYTAIAKHNIPVAGNNLFSDEQKLSVDGFRWAPATLLTRKDYPLVYENITGWYFGPQGMLCRYPGYILSDLPDDIYNYKYIATCIREKAEIWESVHSAIRNYLDFVPQLSGEPNPNLGRFALVLNRFEDSTNGLNRSMHSGLLVYIYCIEGSGTSQCIYARYIQPVRRWSKDDDSSDERQDQELTTAQQSNTLAYADVHYLKELNWCIG